MTIHTFDYIIGTSQSSGYIYSVDELLSEGAQVIGHTVYTHDDDVHERWTLRKDETKAAATPLPQNVQVRLIQQIEVRETYSKSKQQMFKYLRCTLDDDSDFVNIFDHPDSERNTFKIITERGWFDLDDPEWLYVGREIELVYPVAVTISNDGEWNSLVDIMEHDKYALLCSQHGEFDMTTPAPSDGNDDESGNDSWYTESPDDPQSVKDLRNTIDNLRAGISFDNDPDLADDVYDHDDDGEDDETD